MAFLILTGCYIGYLPTHLARKWVDSGQMKPLMHSQFSFVTPYAALTHKEVAPNLVLSAYLTALQQLIDSKLSDQISDKMLAFS